MCPVCPTMTVIATNLINFPFAQQIIDAFKEYSNEYEFTAEGVFQRVICPACPQCGKQMNHNGYNKYHILDLAIIKLCRYHCRDCNISSQEENIFLNEMKSDCTFQLFDNFIVFPNYI